MQTLEEVLATLNLNELGLDGYKKIGVLSGGMNNVNYLIEAHNKKYIVYLPTPGCNDLVNRKDEHYNLETIKSLEISNVNIYHDIESGIKINTYLEGVSSNTISDKDYLSLSKVLKKLHSSNIKFASDYDPFSRLEGYEKQVTALNLKQDDNYFVIRDKFLKYKEYLKSQKLVPCHNDSQPSNFIVNKKDTFIIDFEFAANNDYVYDIACFANVTIEEGLKMLQAYEGEVSKDKLDRFYLWRIYQCLQWYNVALAKYASQLNDIMEFDFKKVADDYLKLAIDLYNGHFES